MKRRRINDTWPEPITAQLNDFEGPEGTTRTMALDELERRLLPPAPPPSLFGRGIRPRG
jgi:hypothetical protein